ncbi:MAG: queuosine precursor transporter [Verrucomicrobiota bacterium]|nr:queuosine precursor transporter [Verrucomicrobiota bacterium]
MSTSDCAHRPTRRWLGPISVVFCTVLVISNISAIKPLSLPGLPFILMDGGNLLFPISYIFGDVLVEVYGYAQSRRVIWMGFAMNLFAALAFSLVVAMPAAPGWEMQDAFASILGQTPRVVFGSMAAFWAGSFLNAWILARMKILTRGRHLWMRTIASTIGGEAIDSLLFTTISFGGVWPATLILHVTLWNFVLKTAYEILATPLPYLIIQRLKKMERSDPYDTHTDFSPFRLDG